MTAKSNSMCWVALISSFSLLPFCGCHNAQTAADLAKTKDELVQAGRRLEAANTQIEAANQQITHLLDDLKRCRNDLESARASAQVTEQNLSQEIRELESRNSQLDLTVKRAQQALAEAESRLAENASATAESEQHIPLVGVWILDVAGIEHRLAFYEDGSLLVRGIRKGSQGVELAVPELLPTFGSPLAAQYKYRRVAANRFEITDATKSARAKGEITLSTEDDGVVLFDLPVSPPDMRYLDKKEGTRNATPTFYDEYGKAKPAPIKRLKGSQLPERSAR